MRGGRKGNCTNGSCDIFSISSNTKHPQTSVVLTNTIRAECSIVCIRQGYRNGLKLSNICICNHNV